RGERKFRASDLRELAGLDERWKWLSANHAVFAFEQHDSGEDLFAVHETVPHRPRQSIHAHVAQQWRFGERDGESGRTGPDLRNRSELQSHRGGEHLSG